MQIGIGLAITNQHGGGSADPVITQFAPDAYYKASEKWYGDGGLQIGWTPQGGYLANYVKSTSTVFQTSTSGWSINCAFKISYDNAGATQCLVSKNTSAKQEYTLRWSASTGLLTLTVYTANGSSTASVTSTVPVAVGTVGYVTCGFNATAGNIFIRVNSETRQTQAIGFSIGINTGEFQVGNDANNGNRLYGVIDSLGWLKDYEVTDADITELNAGTVYRNLSAGLKAKYDIANKGAWFDFGTPTIAADWNTRLTWAWLQDSSANALMLTQATVGGKYPWMTVGLVLPQQTAATDDQVAILLDQSGNSNHIVQCYDGARAGYRTASGPDGGPCFYSHGSRQNFNVFTQVHGSFLPCWTQGPAMTGNDVSWWGAMIFKTPNVYQNSDQFDATCGIYGQSLFGSCIFGFPPWQPYSTSETTQKHLNVIRFGLCPEPQGYFNACQYHWYSERHIQTYNNFSGGGDAYRGRWSPDQWHVAVASYDGTTKTTTLRIDKQLVFSKAQQFDENSDGTHALATQTINAWTWLDSLYQDNFGFPPGATGQEYQEFSVAGNSLYGYFDKMVNKVGTSLNSTQMDALADLLLPAAYQPSASLEMTILTPTTGLNTWFDANFCTQQSRTAMLLEQDNSPLDTFAAADGDPVGTWSNRVGTKLTRYAIADTDPHRPTIKLNAVNSHKAVRFTRANGSQMTTNSFGSLSQGYTITIAMKQWQTNAAQVAFFYASNGSVGAGGLANGTQYYMYAGGSSVVFSVTNRTTWSVWSFVFNGASSKVYRDGVEVASGNPGSNAFPGQMFIGTFNGSTEYIDMDLTHKVVHTTALTAVEAAALSAQITALMA